MSEQRTMVPEVADRFATAGAVADAVLFEGYVLYPYRASARKNQVRYQFGVLVPPGHVDPDSAETDSMRTEVVVDPGAQPVLHVRLRCLHIERRLSDPPWDEAVEQVVDLDPIALLPLAGVEREEPLRFEAGERTDVEDASVLRRREAVAGSIRVHAEWSGATGTFAKVVVTIANVDPWHQPGAARDEVVRHSLVAVHTLLAVEDGAFVSLLDPPADAADAVAGCVNDRTFPVLVGEEGDTGVMLSSPIILYDHPAIAPESQGELYDSTEIDEILALRVLTLTDDEKAEARATDARAAAVIDRCDDMPPELWSRLHGAVRSLRPIAAPEPEPEAVPWWDPGIDESFDPFSDTMVIDGVEVGKGTKVRLRPSRRSDSHDMFLVGMDATVVGVFNDVDDNQVLGVTVDDDPATELLDWQGRYLYFHPDEVEVVRT